MKKYILFSFICVLAGCGTSKDNAIKQAIIANEKKKGNTVSDCEVTGRRDSGLFMKVFYKAEMEKSKNTIQDSVMLYSTMDGIISPVEQKDKEQ